MNLFSKLAKLFRDRRLAKEKLEQEKYDKLQEPHIAAHREHKEFIGKERKKAIFIKQLRAIRQGKNIDNLSPAHIHSFEASLKVPRDQHLEEDHLLNEKNTHILYGVHKAFRDRVKTKKLSEIQARSILKDIGLTNEQDQNAFLNFTTKTSKFKDENSGDIVNNTKIKQFKDMTKRFSSAWDRYSDILTSHGAPKAAIDKVKKSIHAMYHDYHKEGIHLAKDEKYKTWLNQFQYIPSKVFNHFIKIATGLAKTDKKGKVVSIEHPEGKYNPINIDKPYRDK